MNNAEIENLVFTNICDALPDAKGSHARVYMKTRDRRIRKGMFYINGKTPTFASYGSEVKDVVAWAYWK